MSKVFHGVDEQCNVFKYQDSWYFFDECGSDALGPFVTEIEAYAGLIKYAREYLEGGGTPKLKWFRFDLEPSHPE